MNHVECLQLALKLAKERTKTLHKSLHLLKSRPPFISYWGPTLDKHYFEKATKEQEELLALLAHSLSIEYNLNSLIPHENNSHIQKNK